MCHLMHHYLIIIKKLAVENLFKYLIFFWYVGYKCTLENIQ